MTPPPPISTLFPYTTLFRSVSSIVLLTTSPPEMLALQLQVGQRHSRTGRASLYTVRTLHCRPGGPAITDRKSTRLNSSHRTISYAVFCLKKKKREQTHKTN